jgi:hypothetical protein
MMYTTANVSLGHESGYLDVYRFQGQSGYSKRLPIAIYGYTR